MSLKRAEKSIALRLQPSATLSLSVLTMNSRRTGINGQTRYIKISFRLNDSIGLSIRRWFHVGRFGGGHCQSKSQVRGLLGLDEYKTLISKANVGEIVAQLKTYGDFCEDFSAVDNTVRRSQAERLMEKRLFRIYDELRKFCPGSSKSVMPICTAS